jgi:hypothetical protein
MSIEAFWLIGMRPNPDWASNPAPEQQVCLIDQPRDSMFLGFAFATDNGPLTADDFEE